MGLDCSLYAKIYIKEVKTKNIKFIQLWDKENKTLEIATDKLNKLEYNVGYWRKANWIHKWFVDNVQVGEDDKREYLVSRNNLLKLKELCTKILIDKGNKKFAEEVLPPKDGFWFGNTDTSNSDFWLHYFKTLEDAIKFIDIALHYQKVYQAHIYYQGIW